MLTLPCSRFRWHTNVAAVLVLILSGLLSANTWCQDVGRAQFVFGEVVVERGTERIVMQAGSAVRQGDIIRTGADGTVQLVMIDSAYLSLRSNSRMRLDRYQFEQASSAAHTALVTLVTGVLRTFTGELARRNPNQFRMRSPIATIGIRGSGNILAHNEENGTLNYTFTGAHSVTSTDEEGVERTLVSYPGQTVQVLPGQAPRFIPTPAFILAAASPPTKSAKASAAEKTPASTTDSPAANSTSTSGAATVAGGDTPPATPPSDSGTTTAPSAANTATAPADANPPPSAQSTAQSPSNPATIPGATTVGSSQAATATVGASIVSAQPASAGGSGALFRFFSPLSTGGFEGVLGQSSFDGNGGAILDAAGRLVQVSNATMGTFLGGPGSVPPGYTESTFAGTVNFSGGVHRDSFRSPDNSVILGRWEGGVVTVADSSAAGGQASFDLGIRSVSYDVTTPTIGGILGSFTGSTVYKLAGATAPSDSLGRTGALTSASVSANFSARTISGNFGLDINGQNLSLSGSTGLTPGNPGFTFASSQQSLNIACAGACSTLGYLGTMNGQFAGPTGQWMSVSYRVNPNRQPNSGYVDYVLGSIALNANTPPTIGIVIPQSGTANLVFTAPSFLAYGFFGGSFNEQIAANQIVGTLQANFSNQTVSFNASISGNVPIQGPTYQVTATNAPIVGVGFAADTSPQRRAGVGVATVTCSGTPCGAAGSGSGRFDGLFSTNAGNAGQLTFTVGDSVGYYVGGAAFGSSTSLGLVAGDAQRASSSIAGNFTSGAATPARMPMTGRHGSGPALP